MAVKLALNQAVRLFGSAGETAPAALSLTLYSGALLAGGNAVAIRLKHFFGYPADDFLRGLRAAFQLGFKLCIERFDV